MKQAYRTCDTCAFNRDGKVDVAGQTSSTSYYLCYRYPKLERVSGCGCGEHEFDEEKCCKADVTPIEPFIADSTRAVLGWPPNGPMRYTRCILSKGHNGDHIDYAGKQKEQS